MVSFLNHGKVFVCVCVFRVVHSIILNIIFLPLLQFTTQLHSKYISSLALWQLLVGITQDGLLCHVQGLHKWNWQAELSIELKHSKGFLTHARKVLIYSMCLFSG